MVDALIPLGLLLFIALFGYAMIREGRKQSEAKAGLFKEFARRNGLRYQEEDDGMVQEFAQGFDGIGRFYSPSLGKALPKDVVSGTMNGSWCVLFRHSTRFGEGCSVEWFVAGVTGIGPIAERCAVQFCKSWADKNTLHLQDPVVKEKKIGSCNMVVRAASPSYAGRMMEDGILESLANLAGELPFRPEIQVRGERVIAYLADRNAVVHDVETLGDLLEFSRKASGIYR